MFRTHTSCLTAAAIAVIVAALLVLCLPREGCAGYCWPRDVPRYTRTGGYYNVKPNQGDVYTVASILVPDTTWLENWLIGQEIMAINRGVKGMTLRVPMYQLYNGPLSCYASVDIRTWHLCVMAGMRYGVRPSLLVGVRLHEGGNRYPAWSPWGCKPHGRYTLRQEAFLAARIVRRHANRMGWDAWNPTRAQLRRLGGYYTTGRWSATNAHWGDCVRAIMRRAEGE